jgi:ribonuclease VapC
MIVIDSSALLAILLNEPEKQAFEKAIAGAKRYVVSAVNAHETAMILRMRIGRAAVGQLRYLLAKSSIEVVPFNDAQAWAASIAFNRYGKGIHSNARLNLCDCAAYVLAKRMNTPLLFKGSDFTHTDLQSCL